MNCRISNLLRRVGRQIATDSNRFGLTAGSNRGGLLSINGALAPEGAVVDRKSPGDLRLGIPDERASCVDRSCRTGYVRQPAATRLRRRRH